MFEEIPPERRGLDRVRARRFVLGPFVVGGGLVLALLGGSVAVAATVITASTIGLTNPTPHATVVVSTSPTPVTSTAHQSKHPVPSSRSSSKTGDSAVETGSAPSRAVGAGGSAAPSVAPDAVRSAPPAGPLVPALSPRPTTSAATASRPDLGPVATTSAAAAASAAPTPSATPDGNATVYVAGYDATTGSIAFQYAVVDKGAGIGGTDRYSVAGDAIYSARISASAKIISGGVICPPAGSECSIDELIQAAPVGFFADVALDPSGVLLSVIERDNAAYSSGNSPAPGSASPVPSSQ
ncbi:MAG: hypothetical protein JWO63_188 [Frankiales bacterium]|nr:hypothetical protein [Frankiales bacterium]